MFLGSLAHGGPIAKIAEAQKKIPNGVMIMTTPTHDHGVNIAHGGASPTLTGELPASVTPLAYIRGKADASGYEPRLPAEVPFDLRVMQAGPSAIQRTLAEKVTDILYSKDFGVVGDGVTDDTAALQRAVDQATISERTLVVQGGVLKITAPIELGGIGLTIRGQGRSDCFIKASGNFNAVFEFKATAAEHRVGGLTIDTSGTTTQCCHLQQGSLAIEFNDCAFMGDRTGPLVYSANQGLCAWWGCRWDVNSPNTNAVTIDEATLGIGGNIQNVFYGGRIGGIGTGVSIVKSGSGQRVEGTQFIGILFFNTGAHQILVGSSLYTQIVGCVLDQCVGHSLIIRDSADIVIACATWFGGRAPTFIGAGVLIEATAGNGHTISNCFLGYKEYGIAAQATSADRVDGSVTIANNVFSDIVTVSVSLDSVGHCVVTGNTDMSTGSVSSWQTIGTYAGASSYVFDNNTWKPGTPAYFASSGTYRFGNETGIVGRNRGKSAPTAAATYLDINHGLFTTPSTVIVTPEGAAGSFEVQNLTSSTFRISWGTSGLPRWHWQAEV